MTSTPHSQITTHLLTTKSLPVSPTWLTTFLTSTTTSRTIPLSALTQTALFRILTSDIRDSLSTTNPSTLLPADIFDPTIQERRLNGPIPLQVLDIEDIGTSLWSQVEAIERVERGEAIRGREIVRTVNVGEDSEETNHNNAAGGGGGGDSTGPHRLILQDAAGTRAVGVEFARVNGIGLGKLAIGAKVVVRDVTVARGLVMLTPESCVVLGGKIEGLDVQWREGRKERLLGRINGGV
ncbi:hypothetical protein AtubIFM55763_001930 [Aspergillus tubingensis]|uniref:RecQ-mediated genome instability protein 1 n=2 Tax=Aspergillus subgen. Circumdati TaxID=2720871 RepID=A0A124BYT7_ASPNG|nr:hypothetical protein AKAW_02941 [Aspergillus niger]GLA61002.1 hypothetical protein AtubIFM54640_001510 [Aspergillus tubingensis]GLA71490.1 hypothetical protein AtubIFM55763_001930 [Aspergillus tubingensis]GLA87484.1 hypothetical protein AtubIFM56815_001910 [Aspergillus tubingensis]GLA96208.1 hypothetical protein AtubIFM57143_003673 [Aspergillus tubingensis]